MLSSRRVVFVMDIHDIVCEAGLRHIEICDVRLD